MFEKKERQQQEGKFIQPSTRKKTFTSTNTYIAVYNIHNVIQMKKSLSQFDNHIGNSDANQMALYAYK